MSDRKTQSGYSFNPNSLSNVSTNEALNSINGRVQQRAAITGFWPQIHTTAFARFRPDLT